MCLQFCIKGLCQAPPTLQPCGSQGCVRDSDCMAGGVCNATTSACACAAGFAGPRCAISLGPCNTTGAQSPISSAAAQGQLCCGTGVVDRRGSCCGSGESSPSGSVCACLIAGKGSKGFLASGI